MSWGNEDLGEVLCDPLGLELCRTEKAQQISCYRTWNENGEILSVGAKGEL